MTGWSARLGSAFSALLALATIVVPAGATDDSPQIDYLGFARGAVPVAVEGDATALQVGMEQALLAIDGSDDVYALARKPGAADTRIAFVYRLPARTTFTEFVVPNILETPSPSQTFVRTIEVAGSDSGPDGPFQTLASATLARHAKKGEKTVLSATGDKPVRWVRVTLGGGLDVQRDKTFFEFSEIVGHGRQEPVPLLEAFTGKWKGRGVLLELKQEGVRVTGCYDGVGDLAGTVGGNLLHATGKTRDSGVPSTFVLTVTPDGAITGVRSTNGAPFSLYAGAPAPNLATECSTRAVPALGCGSVVHGINFDFDSANVRPESREILDALAEGLKTSTATEVSIVGHTSSEGSEAYNDDLSRRRAEAVVAALVARGIAAKRLLAVGRGEKEPIADNATEAGRSLNRRVEIACR